MIRRRLESASAEPRRVPSSAIPQDDRDDDLGATLRLSCLAEQRLRTRFAKRSATIFLMIVHDSLGKMNSKRRSRVQSLLNCRLGVR